MSVTNSSWLYYLNQNKSFVSCAIKTFCCGAIAYSRGLTASIALVAKFIIIDKLASYFIDNTKRKEILERINARLENIERTSIEAVYLRELKERINATSQSVDPTLMLKAFETSSTAYQSFLKKIQDKIPFNPNLQNISLLYAQAKEELRALESSPITDTERAIYIGSIKEIFRTLDNELSRKAHRPLHQFCGCHIQNENGDKELNKMVSYPSELSSSHLLEGKAAALQSWSLGGGHNVAQRGLSQRLAEMRMHAYHVEADNETLLPLDTMRNLTRNYISDGEFISFLLKNNCWNILQFINWLFSGKPSAETCQKLQDQFIRSLLARGNPELQMTCYARNAGAAANGAAAIGIGHIDFCTDLRSEFYDIQTPSDVPAHFAHGVMAQGEDLMSPSLAETLGDRVHVTGFPVRKAFLETYDASSLRLERGIAADARVVILSSGGVGVNNNYAETIVERYRSDTALDKMHLVVLCGTNRKMKEELEKKFANLNLPHLTVEVRGWTEEDEIAKLYAIAEDPNKRGALISSKGGGGTLSEGLASGVPMLLGSRNEIEWEKVNIEFVCKQRCGIQFKNDTDLMEKLEAVFRMRYRRMEIDSKGKSIRLVRQEMSSAEADYDFQKKRSGALSYRPPKLEDLLKGKTVAEEPPLEFLECF